MRLLVLLLMSTCLVAKEVKVKDESKQPHHKQKQKHRQWLKHPLYIPPGEHFIDESIQPGKKNLKKQSQATDQKTVNRPNLFYQYKTGQTGFKIPFYDPKTEQVSFAQIPGYRRKTGKTGFKTGQTGFVPIPMYMTKTGRTGFKNFPSYKTTETGQAGFVPIPMYMTKTGKTGFKNFPSYKTTETGQAGFVPIPMYMTKTGKTGFKNFPSYKKTETGQAEFVPIPMYMTKKRKTGFKNFPLYKTKTGQAGFLPISMYLARTGKTGFKTFPLYDTKTSQAGFMPTPMYGIKDKDDNPLYGQSGLNQLAMYQIMSGQPVEIPSVPGIVSAYNDKSGLVPMPDTATQPAQPMYLNSPSSPVQEMDTPLLAGNQMSMMYPTSLTSDTGLTGFDNGLMNQGYALPALPFASPALQASEALAQSVLGQANAQAKSIISGPKKQDDPPFTVSVDGAASITLSKKNKVLKQVTKKRQKIVGQGDTAVNHVSGGGSISLSKKTHKVLKKIKKTRQKIHRSK